MGTKEAENQWGIPQNTIARLCREGKIKGAEQDAKGSPWRIPKDAKRPNRRRIRNEKNLSAYDN